MKKLFFSLLAVCATFGLAHAQSSLVIDNFNSGTATGTTSAAVLGYTSSWVGQVTQNASTITVGGSAKDDNGWGANNQSLNATPYSFLAITAQRDATNAGTSFVINFFDDSLASTQYQVSTASFAIGSLTTVYIPLNWSGINSANLTEWNMGGGTSGINPYLMTFDNLAFTTAIPEPSTYAAIFGVACLGAAIVRRQKRRTSVAA